MRLKRLYSCAGRSVEGEDKANFMQPTWTNDQPRMGVPIWSNDPMQAKVFSTDGMMGEIRKMDQKTLIYET